MLVYLISVGEYGPKISPFVTDWLGLLDMDMTGRPEIYFYRNLVRGFLGNHLSIHLSFKRFDF